MLNEIDEMDEHDLCLRLFQPQGLNGNVSYFQFD